jgi:hypothetical protein
MFAQIQGNGYDGKCNDFPYPEYLNGVAYPWVGQLDLFNNNWLCGSTQGSCQMAPAFLSLFFPETHKARDGSRKICARRKSPIYNNFE